MCGPGPAGGTALSGSTLAHAVLSRHDLVGTGDCRRVQRDELEVGCEGAALLAIGSKCVLGVTRHIIWTSNGPFSSNCEDASVGRWSNNPGIPDGRPLYRPILARCSASSRLWAGCRRWGELKGSRDACGEPNPGRQHSLPRHPPGSLVAPRWERRYRYPIDAHIVRRNRRLPSVIAITQSDASAIVCREDQQLGQIWDRQAGLKGQGLLEGRTG